MCWKHTISREQYAYPCKTYHTSFCCRELCQEDAVLLGDKMKSLVNRKCCCLLSMLAIKACNIEASTTLSFEHGATGRNWIPFFLWYPLAQYNISQQNQLYCSIFLPNWIFLAVWRVCFQVLLVYVCLMCKLGSVLYCSETDRKGYRKELNGNRCIHKGKARISKKNNKTPKNHKKTNTPKNQRSPN